jgi:hypothetical protein
MGRAVIGSLITCTLLALLVRTVLLTTDSAPASRPHHA